MIYRFAKKIHKTTAFISVMCLVLASSTSDFYVLEMRQTEPEFVGRLLIAGLIMTIPSLVYGRLELLKEKRNAKNDDNQ